MSTSSVSSYNSSSAPDPAIASGESTFFLTSAPVPELQNATFSNPTPSVTQQVLAQAQPVAPVPDFRDLAPPPIIDPNAFGELLVIGQELTGQEGGEKEDGTIRFEQYSLEERIEKLKIRLPEFFPKVCNSLKNCEALGATEKKKEYQLKDKADNRPFLKTDPADLPGRHALMYELGQIKVTFDRLNRTLETTGTVPVPELNQLKEQVRVLKQEVFTAEAQDRALNNNMRRLGHDTMMTVLPPIAFAGVGALFRSKAAANVAYVATAAGVGFLNRISTYNDVYGRAIYDIRRQKPEFANGDFIPAELDVLAKQRAQDAVDALGTPIKDVALATVSRIAPHLPKKLNYIFGTNLPESGIANNFVTATLNSGFDTVFYMIDSGPQASFSDIATHGLMSFGLNLIGSALPKKINIPEKEILSPSFSAGNLPDDALIFANFIANPRPSNTDMNALKTITNINKKYLAIIKIHKDRYELAIKQGKFTAEELTALLTATPNLDDQALDKFRSLATEPEKAFKFLKKQAREIYGEKGLKRLLSTNPPAGNAAQ